jgi:hypothetical protein
MATTLAFHPRPVDIPVGQSKGLGVVDVHLFERIRVVAFAVGGAAGRVVIKLMIVEDVDDVFLFLDTLSPQPGSDITKAYEVPGRKLSISAEVTGSGSGSSRVGVLVFGFASVGG